MILTLLYLFHEYVAKSFIPCYKLRSEAFEASNGLIECWEEQFARKKRKLKKTQRYLEIDQETVISAEKDLKRLLF